MIHRAVTTFNITGLVERAVNFCGVTEPELEAFIRNGIIKKWKSPSGKFGYIPYTEKQVEIAKKLSDTGRYSVEELRHIFEDWNTNIEIVTIDELAYDSFDINDFEHFKRRTDYMALFFEEELAAGRKEAEAADRLRYWKWIQRNVTAKKESELSEELRWGWRKQLFYLRWADEYARLMSVDHIASQIEQGYSTDVTFDGWSNKGGVTTLTHLNWRVTLSRFKDTRNEGKLFPLRTPAFNVTERGIEFLNAAPSLDEYAKIHEQYKLDELNTLLRERGPALWTCDFAASGRGQCSVCDTIFERTKDSRKYCSGKCRNKAKQRRWRDADPERARKAQAKYYRIYGEIQ